MGIAWMDRGIGAETDLRTDGNTTTARLFYLASMSTIESYSPTTQPRDFELILLLAFSIADYI